MAGLAAFKHFCKVSQLLTAAGVLKLWHARPLALTHLHAWLHDTLHATFYLCWWRWRRRAVARLRLRAFLGLHMYRCVACPVNQIHMPARLPLGCLGVAEETEQMVAASMAAVVGARGCRSVLVLATLPRPTLNLMQLIACVLPPQGTLAQLGAGAAWVEEGHSSSGGSKAPATAAETT